MVGPCKRRKVKNPAGKVSRRNNKNVVKKTAVPDETVGRFWDKKKTIHQNFAKVGLVSKVNADLSSGQIKGKLQQWQSERVENLIEIGEKNMEQDEAEGETAKLMRPMLDEDQIFSRLEELFHQDHPEEAADHPENAGKSSEDSVDVKKTVIDELEARSRMVTPKEPERLSEFERKYIQACIAKHGTNFKKMSLDHKTNSRQLTSRELERMAEKLEIE